MAHIPAVVYLKQKNKKKFLINMSLAIAGEKSI